MLAQSHTRFAFALATLGFAVTAIGGCAASGVSARTPSGTADTVDPSRCSGFTDDKAVADILSGRSVESVSPLYLSSSSKANVTPLLGAVLTVRPSPGETAEWLERALECHGAKGTAVASGTETSSDPFVSSGSTREIAVRSAGDGFRIEVSSALSAEAHDILLRAQGLQAAPRGATNQEGRLGRL